jgi:hypothetical protein
MMTFRLKTTGERVFCGVPSCNAESPVSPPKEAWVFLALRTISESTAELAASEAAMALCPLHGRMFEALMGALLEDPVMRHAGHRILCEDCTALAPCALARSLESAIPGKRRHEIHLARDRLAEALWGRS